MGLGLGVGFYGWSYPYYYSYPSYYAYPYYYSPAYYQDCPPSYYEAPVYPDTNSLYDGTSAPAAGAAATPYGGDRNVPKEVRVPDGFIPRMELPGREAPEALPEEKPVAPPREIPLSESPQSNGSKK